MKTITFSIDLKSFCLGALTLGGVLVLANFTPASQRQPDPDLIDTRRFQAVSSERESIILDTKTGRFLISPSYIGKPRWIQGDFESIQQGEKR